MIFLPKFMSFLENMRLSFPPIFDIIHTNTSSNLKNVPQDRGPVIAVSTGKDKEVFWSDIFPEILTKEEYYVTLLVSSH
jgi:hypothetical protein